MDGNLGYSQAQKQITNTCLLKCPDLGSTFNGVTTLRCPRGEDVDPADCTTVLVSFTCPPIGVSGHVYYDTNGTCSTAQGWNQGAGVKVKIEGTVDSAVVSSGGVDPGFYLINTASTNSLYTLSLDAATIPAGYVCSPACGGCPAKSGVASRSIGNNFFLTKTSTPLESWWQVAGAGVYAGNMGGGISIESKMPSGKYLIIPGTEGTVGALLRASGSVNSGNGSISTDGFSAKTKYRGKKMDYAYFAANMGVVRGVNSD
jgi:hypothetical protein